jgi:hypothetical protein
MTKEDKKVIETLLLHYLTNHNNRYASTNKIVSVSVKPFVRTRYECPMICFKLTNSLEETDDTQEEYTITVRLIEGLGWCMRFMRITDAAAIAVFDKLDKNYRNLIIQQTL